MRLKPHGTNHDDLTDFGSGPGLTKNFEARSLQSFGDVANMQVRANALLAVIGNEFTGTTNQFRTPTGKFGTANRQRAYLNRADFSSGGNSGYGSIVGVHSKNTNGTVSDAGTEVRMVFMDSEKLGGESYDW